MSRQDDHRRPPADRLFCRADGIGAVRPEMAAGEREHFAEQFAESFATALNETRRDGQPPLPLSSPFPYTESARAPGGLWWQVAGGCWRR